MEDLPEALLSEVVKRLTRTSDLNSLSLVSKRLYSIEAELRDAICLGPCLFPVTLAVTSLCSRFPNLNKVEFNYSDWKPNHGSQLDNHGLHVLSSCCPLLTDLTLSFCSSIDDSGLSFLSCFKKLMSLRLNKLPAITSCGLLSVAVGCKSLSALHLIRCKNVSSVEWLEYLGRISSVEELVVSNCRKIVEFDLPLLGAGWMKLRKFELQIRTLPNVYIPPDPSYVADNQYRYNFCCDGLKDLTLVRLSTVPEIGLHCLLSKCKALEKLDLSCVRGLTDNDMVTLAHNCSNLRSISLLLRPEYCEGFVYRTALTDETLKALALCCPMLQSVELAFWGCSSDWPEEIGFTQDGIVKLIQSCPVRELMLTCANIFNNKGMKALSRAQFLESLKLVCIAISDSELRLLACSPRLINLTLWQCNRITDDGLGEVVRARELESLNIEGCCQVSQRVLQGAAKSVQYRDKAQGFVEWMNCCVYGMECDGLEE